MTPRILLAEDEKNLREGIKLNLELEGYEVEEASSGLEAVQLFENQRFNLVILDIMMPELNGLEVCEKIRITDSDTPILFLTAKDMAKDKINGLKLGGDDYMTKPFNLEELILRSKRLVKQNLKTSSSSISFNRYLFGRNAINFSTYEAETKEGKVHLTKKEAQLLKLLIDRKDEVVSRQQILQYVWGYDVFPSTRTIDNFILSFRKYFENDPKKPAYFHSVRGVGYKFMNPES